MSHILRLVPNEDDRWRWPTPTIEYEFAEVAVAGDQDPVVTYRGGEDVAVGYAGAEADSPLYVMTFSQERTSDDAADVRIAK